MNTTTKLLIILGLLAGAGALFFKQKPPTKSNTNIPTFGILQTASHPALDAARKGFIETLEQELNGNVQFLIRNAEGSIPAAHTIAQSFKAHDLDGIFAIATPAAQAAASQEKNKPLFIAAVTDPQAAGICNENVCGCTDMIALDKTIDLLQELLPNARTVAILANSGEINSQVQVEKMQEILQSRGLTPLLFGFTSEADVAPAVTSASLKADALLLPNDNIISSSISLVASLALKHKKPVIACDALLVKHGLLAAHGVDYFNTGVQAAKQSLSVLKDGAKSPALTIEDPLEGTIVINKKTAEVLEIPIPEQLRPYLR